MYAIRSYYVHELVVVDAWQQLVGRQGIGQQYLVIAYLGSEVPAGLIVAEAEGLLQLVVDQAADRWREVVEIVVVVLGHRHIVGIQPQAVVQHARLVMQAGQPAAVGLVQAAIVAQVFSVQAAAVAGHRQIAKLGLGHGAPLFHEARGQGHVVIGRQVPVEGRADIRAVVGADGKAGIEQSRLALILDREVDVGESYNFV